MRLNRMLALGASLLMLLSVSAAGEGSTPRNLTAQASTPPSVEPLPSGPVGDGVIRVGSADFYESAIVAEIYAQVMEANGITVERKLNTGTREVTWAAMQSGADINFMPEYVGFLLETLNSGVGEATADAEATRAILADRIAGVDISVLGVTPASDVNAFVVRPDTAEQYSLTTIGDLAPVAAQLKWGLPPECATAVLCSGALAQYGIDISTLQVTELNACGAEIATALAEGGVDVGELCSTQPDIAVNGFVSLEDDLGTQPTGALAPIVRNDQLRALEANGIDLAAILDPISAAVTTEELTALNVRVGVDQEDVDVVASEWLAEKGLLPAA
jgi:osmoprotectant transport system substrate-binding protein